jgi:hypothetical protein
MGIECGRRRLLQEDPGTVRTRGKLFTLVLLFFTLSQPIGFVFFCYNLDLIAPGSRLSAVIEMLFYSVTALIALAGVWGWRRWGVYLLALGAVFGFLADLFSGVPLSEMGVRIGVNEVTYGTEYSFIPGPPAVFGTMIALILCIYRRWRWFH